MPAGWDVWYAFTGSRARYYDYEVNDNGTILSFGHRPVDYSTDVLKERAVRFIADEAAKPEPFFLYIAPKAAHAQGKRAIVAPQYADAFKDVGLPFKPSFNEEHIARKALKAPLIHGETKQELIKSYRAELQSLQSVDDLVEAVVEALQQAGKLDDTVIIYTSDNGFLFGEHRLIGKSAGYEESIKVPLVMRGPGIPKNETRGALVNNLDVVATIAELTGASPGYALDGKSLAPLFADANAPWRSAILFESPINRFQTPNNRFTGVRTATRKYVKYASGFEELFDLQVDPHELDNLAGEEAYAGDLVSLRSLNDTLKDCAGQSCFVP